MIDDPLAFARAMIDLGVPVFHARMHEQWCRECNTLNEPCHFAKLGFWLPRGWQFTEPDHSLLEAWRPGDALCAVMGHVFDLVDYDLRNDDEERTTEARLFGADGSRPLLPLPYAEAWTPSGGRHYFIKSLNVRSIDNLMPGLDIKAGTKNPDDNESHGRGYAFITPTIKMSKKTGRLGTYRVDGMPRTPRENDNTGAELYSAIRQHWRLTHPEPENTGGGFHKFARHWAIGRAIIAMKNAPEGQRDITLTKKIWLLANNGATQADYDKLAAAARDTGLDAKLVEQKIQRAVRRTGGGGRDDHQEIRS